MGLRSKRGIIIRISQQNRAPDEDSYSNGAGPPCTTKRWNGSAVADREQDEGKEPDESCNQALRSGNVVRFIVCCVLG